MTHAIHFAAAQRSITKASTVLDVCRNIFRVFLNCTRRKQLKIELGNSMLPRRLKSPRCPRRLKPPRQLQWHPPAHITKQQKKMRFARRGSCATNDTRFCVVLDVSFGYSISNNLGCLVHISFNHYPWNPYPWILALVFQNLHLTGIVFLWCGIVVEVS